MSPLFFEQLAPIKIPLIQRFYKQHYPSAKVKKDELVIIAREESTLCAVVRFRQIEHYQLLTGMVVDQTKRNQGVGHRLLAFVNNITSMIQYTVLLFEHLAEFYQHHHFCRQHPDHLPPAIKTLYSRYCRQGKKFSP
ncbi:GNAT family N-acetyltransferase [Vibrio sp. PP-XX7]